MLDIQTTQDGRARLVDLSTFYPVVRLDIRYATFNNFMGRPLYPQARAFLQPVAAEALARTAKALAREGLGLLVFDAYRPWSVTKAFWEWANEDQKPYVADPAVGSRHNRACSVDLTLVELWQGRPLPMPSEYDEFTVRAHPTYPYGTPAQRANRDLLRDRMERAGFTVNPQEWWHFDHQDWEAYPVMDLPFDQLEEGLLERDA